MSLRENLVELEKKWSWSFFGFLLAIIFGALAIYTSFYQSKNPKLEFLILSNSNVLDVKENVRNLDILYKGSNIKEKKENLSLVTVQVINNSNVNILKNYYDEISPIGLEVVNGEIVENPQILDASNEYLRKQLRINIDSAGGVLLPNLIIEGNEYFTFSLLLLHKSNSVLKFKSFGKIAGQINSIPIINRINPEANSSMWHKLLEGSIWIHIFRLLFYFLVIIAVAFGVLLPLLFFSDWVKKQKRKRRVKRYKAKKKIVNSQETDNIFELYIKYSLDYLEGTQSLISDEINLKRAFKKFRSLNKNIKDDGIIEYKTVVINQEQGKKMPYFYRRGVIGNLLRMKMITVNGNDIEVNKIFQDQLNDFVSYLKLI